MKAIIFYTNDATGYRSKFVAVCANQDVEKTIYYYSHYAEIEHHEVVNVSNEHEI